MTSNTIYIHICHDDDATFLYYCFLTAQKSSSKSCIVWVRFGEAACYAGVCIGSNMVSSAIWK